MAVAQQAQVVSLLTRNRFLKLKLSMSRPFTTHLMSLALGLVTVITVVSTEDIVSIEAIAVSIEDIALAEAIAVLTEGIVLLEAIVAVEDKPNVILPIEKPTLSRLFYVHTFTRLILMSIESMIRIHPRI